MSRTSSSYEIYNTALWSHADTITKTTSSSSWTGLKPGTQKRNGQRHLNCHPDSFIVSKPSRGKILPEHWSEAMIAFHSLLFQTQISPNELLHYHSPPPPLVSSRCHARLHPTIRTTGDNIVLSSIDTKRCAHKRSSGAPAATANSSQSSNAHKQKLLVFASQWSTATIVSCYR